MSNESRVLSSVEAGSTSIAVKVRDFDLEATLESGQVFGFRRNEDGAFEGVISGCHVTLHQQSGTLRVEAKGPNLGEVDVRFYFDLDRDLSPVYDILGREEPLCSLPYALEGLRVIRQDPWESLAGFILSANNNIKRVQGIWRNLSLEFSNGSFRFPSARDIAGTREIVLRRLGLGYRAPFLLDTARLIAADPGTFHRLRDCRYDDAKLQLVHYPGVGAKIADCVLLFGFQKYEAFPLDVWVWRAMRKLYFRNRKVPKEKVRAFARTRWGGWAGYIQQYLYHGARKGLI